MRRAATGAEQGRPPKSAVTPGVAKGARGAQTRPRKPGGPGDLRRSGSGHHPADEGPGGPRDGRTAALEEIQQLVDAIQDRLASHRPVRREKGATRTLGRKATATRATLLRAAHDVFVEHGYRSVAIVEIAERAGVSLGTFYQYFRDRDDVITALVADSVEDLAAAAAISFDVLADGRDGFHRAFAAYVAHYATTATFQAVWEDVTHSDAHFAALRRDLGRLFTAAVEAHLETAAAEGRARKDLDLRLVAESIGSMVDRQCYLSFVVGDPERPPPCPAELARVLAELAADGARLP